MAIIDEEWVVMGGSIYSAVEKRKHNQDFSRAKDFVYHDVVAFNVGDKLAKHIVELHNASLGK